jgi:hypothetical protein
LAIDGSWNTYVWWSFRWTWYFGDTILLSSGSNWDIFVWKVSNTWQWIRATRWWSSGTDYIHWIDFDSWWNVYVGWTFYWTGVFWSISLYNTSSSPEFVGKLSSTWEWLRIVRWGWGIIEQDSLWNSYVWGTLSSSWTFGATTLENSGLQDYFIGKISNTWERIWATKWGWTWFDYVYWMDIDSSWNTYIIWSFQGTW